MRSVFCGTNAFYRIMVDGKGMREILFRGKSDGNKEWIKDGEWVDGLPMYTANKSEKGKIDRILTLRDGYYSILLIDPETVCQYTGMTDKSGKRIFDGDILSAHLDENYPEDITYVQITWNGFSWCTRESTEDDIMTEHDCNIFEVCGNIFDNPDLIGEKP